MGNLTMNNIKFKIRDIFFRAHIWLTETPEQRKRRKRYEKKINDEIDNFLKTRNTGKITDNDVTDALIHVTDMIIKKEIEY